MTTKTVELEDLPNEMQQLLVEKCDLISRCKLRAVSVGMNELVASTKLFIPVVRIKQLSNDGVMVKLTIKPFKDEYTLKFKRNENGGLRLCQSFRRDIIVEDSEPVDQAVAWFKTMCLQKNVSIGTLTIETSDKAEYIVRKFGELLQNTERSIKIKKLCVDGSGAADLMWKFMERCEVSELKELRVMTTEENENFELFGKQDVIVKGLENLEIDCNSIITDEVLSLNAKILYLKSENATEDMVSCLIEKFMMKREAGSAFCIENPTNKIFRDILPNGFSEAKGSTSYRKDYENYLDNLPTVYLRVSEDSVRLEVGTNTLYRFWTNNDDAVMMPRPLLSDDSDSDYDVSDHFEDMGDDYYYDYDPDSDILERWLGSDIEDEDEIDFNDLY